MLYIYLNKKEKKKTKKKEKKETDLLLYLVKKIKEKRAFKKLIVSYFLF